MATERDRAGTRLAVDRRVIDDPTFPYRVAFGLAVFAVLGAIDVLRNPRNPKRLKEYAFLFAVTGAVMLYGLGHDAVTFTLSPEYFHAVKGLRTPTFFPDVAKLALMASWTAGLAIGLVLLVANNPSPTLPQLRYPRLARYVEWPLGCSLLADAAAVAIALVWPRWCADVLDVDARETRASASVALVWCIHIASYAGAIVGLVIAAVQVRRERRRMRSNNKRIPPGCAPSRPG